MTPSEPPKRRVSLDLSGDLVDWLDGLKAQLGHRSRGAILEHLLGELRQQEAEEDDLEPDPADAGSAGSMGTVVSPVMGALDDSTAIVLISSGEDTGRDLQLDQSETSDLFSGIPPSGLATVPR
ncbi:MAG: molecular chaperone DnaJ, partial [Cyanobium sp.]